MRSIRRLWRILRKPPRVWGMVFAVLFMSAWYRWHILKRPFSELSGRIGTMGLETSQKPQTLQTIREVQYAVSGVCSHTPWQSKCLVQALCAKKLLNRAGLPCTLYMGVAPDPKGNGMLAHAWLRCGDRMVTGGSVARFYTVTTIYGDKEPEQS